MNSTDTLSLIYNADEFQSPIIKGWLCGLHNAIVVFLLVISFRIQKVVATAFQRLGSRHINSIIVPTLLLMDVVFPILLGFYVLRSLYYPMSEVFGNELCYLFNFLQIWAGMSAQFHSFFLTLFRYICLFNDDKMLKLNISPKNLAKGILVLHHLLPLCLTFFLTNASIPTRTLNNCLGHYELNIERTGNIFCTEGNLISKTLCKTSFATYLSLASNIPEAFLLYPCFKKIKEMNEQAKSVLGEMSYIRRRRDIGVVINISILQWAIEVGQLMIYLIFITFFNGYDSTLDKFFSLYMGAFMLIQPAFWLSGDIEFRTKLSTEGILSAIKSIIFP